MHPELTYIVNTQRNREMRDQAAEWRRVRQARAAARPRQARIRWTAIADRIRTLESVRRLKPVQRPAAS
jgi:hypothetical protein